MIDRRLFHVKQSGYRSGKEHRMYNRVYGSGWEAESLNILKCFHRENGREENYLLTGKLTVPLSGLFYIYFYCPGFFSDKWRQFILAFRGCNSSDAQQQCECNTNNTLEQKCYKDIVFLFAIFRRQH